MHPEKGKNGHSGSKSRLKAFFRRLSAVGTKEKFVLVKNACKRKIGSKNAGGEPGLSREELEASHISYRKDPVSVNDSYLAVIVDNLDRGGLEEVVRLLTEEWRSLGKNVRVLCLNEGGYIADKISDAGTEVKVFHGDRKSLKEYLLKNRPYIANTHFVHDGIEVFYELGIPVVEVIHNMYVFMDESLRNAEIMKQGFVDGYIAVSECAKDIYLKMFPDIPSESITVVGNTFAKEMKSSVSREEVRKELGIPSEAFVFIAVGSIDHRKNCLGMLKALSELGDRTKRDVRLLFVGTASDVVYYRKIEKFIKKYHLKEKVIFTGERNDVNDLLSAADAFLMLSYYEGWSVAATEALSAGLPMIHSLCGSAKELICDGKNGILVPNPIKGIEEYSYYDLLDAMYSGVNEGIPETVDAMLSMIENEQKYKDAKSEISGFITDNFSNKETAMKYEKVFEDIIRKCTEV